MCSPLGSAMNKLALNGHCFEFDYLKPDIQKILCKNKFLSKYGYEKITDQNQTTIQFLELKPNQGHEFLTYIQAELLRRPELPKLSELLKKKMTESIFEIFQNAKTHSKSKEIITCGQFFQIRIPLNFLSLILESGSRKTYASSFGAMCRQQKQLNGPSSLVIQQKTILPGDSVSQYCGNLPKKWRKNQYS